MPKITLENGIKVEVTQKEYDKLASKVKKDMDYYYENLYSSNGLLYMGSNGEAYDIDEGDELWSNHYNLYSCSERLNQVLLMARLMAIADIENDELNWRPSKQDYPVYYISTAGKRILYPCRGALRQTSLPVPFKSAIGANNAQKLLGKEIKELFTLNYL